MLNSFPMQLIVGTLLGFLSGLGIGGGSLLVLYLTLVLQTAPDEARLINLVFFIPAALISCFLRHREGSLNIRGLLPAILPGCAAAVLFSWIASGVNPQLLRTLFGIILLAAGLREVFYRPRKDR